ncbi:MAG: hypothetical protein DRP64_15875 [Verrucomicrobia bacterium]|nr:MAG: hypothetical protein DRP64_15875 [Verrucomicrobiota bacterium]
MEDLIPLIFFLIIVGVNVLKFFIEKGGKAKKAPDQNREAPPRRASPLESFFEDLAQQMAPKPTELADWPEDRERPDYAREMEEFTSAESEEVEEEKIAEIIPFSVPEPIARVRKTEAPVKVQRQTTQPMLSGSQGMRMRSMNSGGNRGSDFRIGGKKNLKRAMLAHIVFSPPRAFDLSFDNTISK